MVDKLIRVDNPVDSLNNQQVDQKIEALPPIKKDRRPYVIGIIIIIVIMIIVGILLHSDSTKAPTITDVSNGNISITSSGFVPTNITVRVGQVVTWKNNDVSLHRIASDPYPSDDALKNLNSQGPIVHGQTYSYTFTKAGTYTYHDDLNPNKFNGTIVVNQ